MGKLVLFLADGTTLDIPLERDRLTIGRHAGNDVCLPYPAVSGAHAVVVPVTAGAVIEDLGSTNGTLVNGKRVPRQFLHDGDRIDIGRQKLVYLADVHALPVPAARAAAGEARPEPGEAVEPGEAADEPAGSEVEEIAAAPSIAGRAEATSDAITGPMLRVLTGPNAGRTITLTKDETLVGRVGVQVVVLRKTDEGYRLVPMEGSDPPRVNGVVVPGEGVLLQSGDAVEVAGSGMEFQLVDARQPAM